LPCALFGLAGGKQGFLNIAKDIFVPLFKAGWEIVDFYAASLYRQHLGFAIGLLIHPKGRL
jgi:hypothetical protein